MRSFINTLVFAAGLMVFGISASAQSDDEVPRIPVEVTDLRVQGDSELMYIFYSMSDKCDVELYVSLDEGATYKGPLKHVDGAVGNAIDPGNDLMIKVNPLTIMGASHAPSLKFQVRAWQWSNVTDIRAQPADSLVYVFYNLSDVSDIEMYVSFDDGNTFKGPQQKVSGGVGKDVQPGMNMICWNAYDEVGSFDSEAVRFKITSDIVSQKQSQSYDIFEETQEIMCKDYKIVMCKVEGGKFYMGTDDTEASIYEIPAHEVRLDTYYISKTEVTQRLWNIVMGYNNSSVKGDELPVDNVTYLEAVEFLGKLKKLTRRKFLLPTEAQWEFAARGGIHSFNFKYPGGNSIDDVANWRGYDYTVETAIAPVGQRKSNELGLLDMAGNVVEFVRDGFEKSFYESSANEKNPYCKRSKKGFFWPIFRGGLFSSGAWKCRPTYRNRATDTFHYPGLGFRLVLE